METIYDNHVLITTINNTAAMNNLPPIIQQYRIGLSLKVKSEDIIALALPLFISSIDRIRNKIPAHK